MNAFGELTASFTGWSESIAGKAEAERHFVLTRRGLAVAVLWFVVAMLLASAVQSAGAFPSLLQVLFGLIAELVTLGLVGLAIQQSLRRLQVTAATERLLVPVTYALAYMFVVSIPLVLIGTGLALLAVVLVAAMIARAAQVLGGLKPLAAAGVAGVCLLALVIVPYALYMLLSLFPTA